MKSINEKHKVQEELPVPRAFCFWSKESLLIGFVPSTDSQSSK